VSVQGCFFGDAQCNGSSDTGDCGKGYRFDLEVSALFGLASVNTQLACNVNHQFLNCCGRRRFLPFLSDTELKELGFLTLEDVGGNEDLLNY